jgi:hypothetical protein
MGISPTIVLNLNTYGFRHLKQWHHKKFIFFIPKAEIFFPYYPENWQWPENAQKTSSPFLHIHCYTKQVPSNSHHIQGKHGHPACSV